MQFMITTSQKMPNHSRIRKDFLQKEDHSIQKYGTNHSIGRGYLRKLSISRPKYNMYIFIVYSSKSVRRENRGSHVLWALAQSCSKISLLPDVMEKVRNSSHFCWIGGVGLKSNHDRI